MLKKYTENISLLRMIEEFDCKYQGLGVSDGVAHGKLFHVIHGDTEIPSYPIQAVDVEKEISRFHNAIIKTRRDILSLKDTLTAKVGEAEAAIFDAHLMVLEDVAIIDETCSTIRNFLHNAECCYSKVVGRFVEAFNQIDDDFMRERVTDVKDVARRVIQNLLGLEKYSSTITEPVILISNDFLPSDFAMILKKNILAIVSEKGSRTRHTAIISRSLNIPCIVGVKVETLISHKFDNVLVDGYRGLIICNPSQETLESYSDIQEKKKNLESIFNSSLPYKSETKDGFKFKLCMNINGASDIPEKSHMYSDGVGLFRTENFFIDNNKFIDEETQFQYYKAAVEGMKGKPVVIRTLDLGGDKTFALLNSEDREINPFLGYRAIRFCLDHEKIFSEQLRAILRASAFGKVRILYPMISCLDELLGANKILEKVKNSLRVKNISFDEDIEIGVMLEVPSLALIIDTLEGHCSFLSIGTNDLIQYLLAVDRVNDHVAHLYNPCNPSVVRILSRIVQDAIKSRLKVSICGEMASEIIYAPLLIGLGIEELSMTPSHISAVKFFLRKLYMTELEALCDKALSLKTVEEISNLLQDFYDRKFKPHVEYD